MSILSRIFQPKPKKENISPEVAETVRAAYAAIRESRETLQRLADDDARRMREVHHRGR